MTLTKGLFKLECDNCHHVVELDTPNFNRAMDKIHEMRWTSHGYHDGWHHYCGKCQITMAAEREQRQEETRVRLGIPLPGETSARRPEGKRKPTGKSRSS